MDCIDHVPTSADRVPKDERGVFWRGGGGPARRRRRRRQARVQATLLADAVKAPVFNRALRGGFAMYAHCALVLHQSVCGGRKNGALLLPPVLCSMAIRGFNLGPTWRRWACRN
jgi:hypothetical protein